MRIGTMFLGEVDKVLGQSIQTKFFILGVPLFPLESYFVLEEKVSGVEGFEIPMNGKSVLFGYLRMYSFLGAFLAGIFCFIERRPGPELYALTGICAVTAIVTSFFLGKASSLAKQQRTIFGAVTGIAATPDMLPTSVAENVQSTLTAKWALGIGGYNDWRRDADKIVADPELVGVLFVTAAYAGRSDPEADQIASRAWDSITNQGLFSSFA